MERKIISKELNKVLRKKEFINVGSCDFKGRPNVAPKFLLKVDGDYMYLVDYVMGRTWRNLKKNPRLSLSTLNQDTLMGYQLNGSVDMIKEGSSYEKLLTEYRDKQIDFSAVRVAEGVRRGREHEHTEAAFPEKVVFFKVKIEEIVKIVPTGKLNRRKSKQ